MKTLINIGKACVATLFAGAMLTACSSDFLDRPPLGTTDQETFLSTEDAGFKLLVNCYQPITDHWNFQQMRFDMGDQLTDD